MSVVYQETIPLARTCEVISVHVNVTNSLIRKDEHCSSSYFNLLLVVNSRGLTTLRRPVSGEKQNSYGNINLEILPGIGRLGIFLGNMAQLIFWDIVEKSETLNEICFLIS